MTKARIGIIGVGWWTTTAHIPSLIRNVDAELVAMADMRSDVMAKATDTYKLSAKQYTNYKEMLQQEQLDGVIISTNHTTHYEIAKDCIAAGKHVMLEKPMVLTAQHAYDLHDSAQNRGIELIIGYPWHFTENTRRAREIVQSGELGAIQYVSSLFTSMVMEFYRGNDENYRPAFGYPVVGPSDVYADPLRSGGGQAHLQMTHSAGTLFFVTNLRADRVSSFMSNLDVRVDVCDAISVRFMPQMFDEQVEKPAAVGVLGSTGNIGIGDSGVHELQVYGERGRLTLDHVMGTLYVRKFDGTEQRFDPLPPTERYPSGATSANLVDVVLGKAQNGSPAYVAVRVVELLDAAYRSVSQNGQAIDVSSL
ncbi:MAG: Gfo/Idh/MocA family oxidoreductase [Chloroflexota bacterium]|nr:Gfo/Idh/MocA family oxidoreductase [Chloroflexota bacterium]